MLLPPLLAITPGDDRPLAPWLVALGEAGLPGVLLREPQRSADDLRALAAVAQHHVPVVWVHGRCRGAEAQRLPTHCPSTGAPPDARRPWGRSCHSLREVDDACRAGAAWVFLSPIWRPTSKPDDRRTALGLDEVAHHGQRSRVYALGGVTADRHRTVLDRGLAGSAVLGGLFGASSPEEAVDRLRAYLRPDGSTVMSI